MSSLTIGFLTLALLFILILKGVHIGIAVGGMGLLGCYLITGNINVVLSLLSTASFSFVREYNFAVIPLFILMGVFMSLSGAAAGLFEACNFFLRKVRGGLGVATVFANAVFAAVTGVSVASASVFSKVAVPEMKKFKYDTSFAVGAVCGSSVLGMLIPPSVLMILYGMLAEVSIGRLFIAGIIPGLILTLLFSIWILINAYLKPSLVGQSTGSRVDKNDQDNKCHEIYTDSSAPLENVKQKENDGRAIIRGALPTVLLIGLVMGGIWGGFFTPSEAAGVGALGAMIIAIVGGMRLAGFKEVVAETASSTASIMFLLIAAALYSKMLSLAGIINWLSITLIALNITPLLLLVVFMVVIMLMGCILDSSSILLITTPLMVPIISALGFDLLWWGIVVIVCVEMGLLTPPFGMCVFAVKAALGDLISVEQIFRGSVPYLVMMVILVIILTMFPELITWLPSKM
jgi:C4-dicarboxylate transporter DctM subunit